MATANDIINRAMRIAGILGESEIATAAQAADGLTSLNDMLASWQIKRGLIFHTKEISFSLIADQSTYTIGSGGDFNTTRPDYIEYAYIQKSGIDYPVEIVTLESFKGITSKTVDSDLPDHLYYETAFPLGKLHIYPTPSEANTLYLNVWNVVQSFSALTDAVSLPPGYERAIKYNLAAEIAPEYGVSITPEAAKIARDSKMNIIRRNARPVVARMDAGIVRSGDRYNIYGDS